MAVASAARATATIEVRDEAGAPVAGAEVFLARCVAAGTTDGMGRLVLPSAKAGDHVQVRKLVKSGTSTKADHDGWGYHVYLTNIAQNDDGTQSDTRLTTDSAPQPVVVKRHNAQIGLHLVGSVQYNATRKNLDEIALGLERASRYLFDVTDGQMFIERSVIRESGAGFESADIQYFPAAWPSANVSARDTTWGHLYMPGPGFNGNSYPQGGWLTSNGFRTIIHELGHYVIGAWDEYITMKEGVTVPSSCTLDRAMHAQAERASLMDYQYDATEMCDNPAASNHNPDTVQGQTNNGPVWGTFVANWSGAEWALRTPNTRTRVNPGPNDVSCTARTTSVVDESKEAACEPLVLTVSIGGAMGTGLPVTLQHGDRFIAQGTTDGNGRLTVYGAAAGDVLSVMQVSGNKAGITTRSGEVTVGGCGALTLEAQERSRVFYYDLRPRFRLPRHEIEIQVPWREDGVNLPDGVRLLIERPGMKPQPIALQYDLKQHMFQGVAPIERGEAPRVRLLMEVDDGRGGVMRTSAAFEGVRFSARGRGAGAGGMEPTAMDGARAGWELLAADQAMGVSVAGASFPDDTSITVGDATAIAEPPPGRIIVGGPYSIQADQEPTGRFGLRLAYATERYCGLVEGSAAIHRFDGTEWIPIDTELDQQHTMALGGATRLGTYAVMATPLGESRQVPAIQCGDELRLMLPKGEQGLEHRLDPPSVRTACGDAAVSGRRSDGQPLDAPLPGGTTTIEWTVSTSAGQSSACTQTVVVKEEPAEEPPACTSGCCCTVGPQSAPTDGIWTATLGALLLLGWSALARRRRRA